MFKAAWLGLVAAFVLNTSGAAPQTAPPRQLSDDPADKALVHELLLWITSHTNYKMPAVEPELTRLPSPLMSLLACGQLAQCPVVGIHYTGSYIVFITTGLSIDADRHIALHELVHYLQSRADPNLGGCKRVERDENEAYALQYLFRTKTQGYVGPPPPKQILCGPTNTP
jgi:hypothetical protein